MYPLRAFVEQFDDANKRQIIYGHLGRAMVGRHQDDGIQECLVFEAKEVKHLDWLCTQLSKILPHSEVVTKDRPLWGIIESDSNPRSVIVTHYQKDAKSGSLFTSLACGETIRVHRTWQPAVSRKIEFVPIFLTQDATSQFGIDAGVTKRLINVEVTKIPENAGADPSAFIKLCMDAYDKLMSQQSS